VHTRADSLAARAGELTRTLAERAEATALLEKRAAAAAAEAARTRELLLARDARIEALEAAVREAAGVEAKCVSLNLFCFVVVLPMCDWFFLFVCLFVCLFVFVGIETDFRMLAAGVCVYIWPRSCPGCSAVPGNNDDDGKRKLLKLREDNLALSRRLREGRARVRGVLQGVREIAG
jgi:hypothetical protein